MTHDHRSLSFEVEALTRVEGEGGLIVEIHEGKVQDVRLRIFEPPRFFESFLRGRAYTEPPDITARICGICPVAYQMSSCQAIEAACGATLDAPLRDLRHLLYCGEWIESHVLHIHLLHAPDFLGYPSGIAMAADHLAEVERGLRLKQIGNQIVEVVGGRAVHPINVKLGGFYKAPAADRMRALADDLRWATDAAEEVVRWVATFPMPDHTLPDDTVLVALRHPTEYAILDGRLVSTSGLDIGADEYLDHFAEEQVQHSTALHGRLLGSGDYMVGPLARFVLNADRLAPRAGGVGRRARADHSGAQPVPQHPRARDRDAARVRGGFRAHRKVRGAVATIRGRASTRRGRLRLERGAARIAVAPLRAGIRWRHRRRPDRAADVAEPTRDRARPPPPDRALARARRPSARGAVRTGGAQLRSVHLVRHSLPRHASPAHVSAPEPITVIGIGNPYRHDDGAGLVVLAKLQRRFGDDQRVRLVELDGEPVGLIQAWQGSDRVVIVDAVRSLQPAGTIHRFSADGLDGVTADGVRLGGGHLLGLGEAIHLARALGRLPRTVEVIGIEGAEFGLGEGLSPPVASACALVAGQLTVQIEQLVSSRP